MNNIANGANNRVIFFIIEEAKKKILLFLRGTVKVLSMSSYDLAIGHSTICFVLI